MRGAIRFRFRLRFSIHSMFGSDLFAPANSSEHKGFVCTGPFHKPSRSPCAAGYHRAMRSTIVSVLFVVAATGTAGCVTEVPAGFEAPDEEVVTLAATVPLSNGTAISGLGATKGQELHFALDVPTGASNLRFVIG